MQHPTLVFCWSGGTGPPSSCASPWCSSSSSRGLTMWQPTLWISFRWGTTNILIVLMRQSHENKGRKLKMQSWWAMTQNRECARILYWKSARRRETRRRLKNAHRRKTRKQFSARAQLCICVVALGLNNGPRNSFTITNLPSNDFFHRRRLDVNFLTDLPDLSLPQLPIRYNALTTPSHKSAHTNSSRYRNQVIHAACVIH